MDETTKRAIKKTILALRNLFEKKDIPAVLKRHGIFPDGRRVPIEKLALLDNEGKKRRERLEAIIKREVRSVSGDQKLGVQRYCREVAFTYLNRLIALRCMEVRGLIDECIKIRDDYAGRSLKHHRFLKEHAGIQFDAEDTDSLKGFLCSVFSELHNDIKILFDPDDEYSIIMPSLQALRECSRALNKDIPEDAFKEPELLGWVYQYFQIEEKDRVFEEVRTKKKKIEGDDIVPATSLYTERYMVDYLVQNSLGAIWMEMYPDSKLCENWPYFVRDQDLKPREPRPIKSLTFLDPACGSGHFLIVAFDLLVPMYEEEVYLSEQGKIPKEWVVPKEKIATAIIESNLHGIDIDLRSVQIAYLALYLKMREHQKSMGVSKELSKRINLVAADASLLDTPEFMEWCEDKFKKEQYIINILKDVVSRLRNLSEIGSLARPEEDLSELIRREKERLLSAWKKNPPVQPVFDFYLTEEQKQLSFEKISDDQFWQGVLTQVTRALDEYYKEASERGDTRVQVLAHEASRGFKFLELCNKRYDVVATNPPYMGSKNMGKELKDYVQRAYPEGKRDLYAAFIQRNRNWTAERGIISMVTQQSWMFLRSFVKMREQILKKNSIQTLAHLGEHAFDDSAAAGAFVVLFTIVNEYPSEDHRLFAFRVIVPKLAEEKKDAILRSNFANNSPYLFNLAQKDLFNTPRYSILYWLKPKILEIFKSHRYLEELVDIKRGLDTGDNNRFIRFFWEVVLPSRRWFNFSKGGGYRKWWGFTYYMVDWGKRKDTYQGIIGARVQNVDYYFKQGLTYTPLARGSLGVRFLPANSISTGIYHNDICYLHFVASVLNTRITSYLMRFISPELTFKAGYLKWLPISEEWFSVENKDALKLNAILLTDLKKRFTSMDLTEQNFDGIFYKKVGVGILSVCNFHEEVFQKVLSIILLAEFINDLIVFDSYKLDSEVRYDILDETGISAGWHPSIEGYDTIPETDIYEIPREVSQYLENHRHIKRSEKELIQIKSRLRALYETGPSTKLEDVVEEGESQSNDDEGKSESLTGERIPIPTETFLEELSVKMEIHPISIYWLLKEMREKEGLVCWPECKRYVEDYFTVMILKILGFRWPKQIEANEPVPDWVDKDGIIPITEHAGEKTLFERIRDRVAAEFGEDRIGAIETEFADILYNAARKEAEIKGKRPPRKKITLAQWLEKEFFKRHTSQFKKRPIAWHLTSSNGTLQVLLFSHKISQDMLKNLKNRYLAKVQTYYGTLLEKARRGESVPGGFTTGKLSDIESELEEFANKLDQIINMPYEPLIDDGVRVNIAPLQKLGLLPSPVLAAKDVDRAIAGRNRWREDDKEQNTKWNL